MVHSFGLRYRLHRRDLPGNPDLVFLRHRLALFVHGCFWHRHPGCKRTTTPKSREDFWQDKFRRNIERDQEAVERLETLGWRVEVIWECETKNREDLSKRINGIFSAIQE